MQTASNHKPIPTAITIAPRGHSFHGQSLRTDQLGSVTRPTPPATREQRLIDALACIVLETMDYSPAQRINESFLPAELIEQAQQALDAYGMRILPDETMIAQGGAA